MRNQSRGKLVVLTSTLIVVFSAVVTAIYNYYSAPLVNHSPYQKIEFEQAEQRMGFRIPLPTYLPIGYTLDGIYMYPSFEDTATVTNTELPPRPPLEPFQIAFRRKADVLVLRLYGGDTRSEESRAATGGDIPMAFDLSGETVEVNGSAGLMQSDIDERSIFDTKISLRLVWRFPYTSSKMPNLRALFLAVEGDGLSPSDLLEVAKSVR